MFCKISSKILVWCKIRSPEVQLHYTCRSVAYEAIDLDENIYYYQDILLHYEYIFIIIEKCK